MFGNAKLREFAAVLGRNTLSCTESTFQCFFAEGACRGPQRVGKETPGETFQGSSTVHRVAKKTDQLYESRRDIPMASRYTRRFHELVGNPRQPRPPIFQSYFLRSFFRSFVRHRHPVAASYRLFSRRRGLTSSVSHLGHASRDQEALEQLRGHVAAVLEDAVERARAAVVVAAESAAFREGRRRK